MFYSQFQGSQMRRISQTILWAQYRLTAHELIQTHQMQEQNKKARTQTKKQNSQPIPEGIAISSETGMFLADC